MEDVVLIINCFYYYYPNEKNPHRSKYSSTLKYCKDGEYLESYPVVDTYEEASSHWDTHVSIGNLRVVEIRNSDWYIEEDHEGKISVV